MIEPHSHTTPYFKTQALKVKQPLGTFYVATIPASILLSCSYSHRLRAVLDEGSESYRLEGSQRELMEPRLRQIAGYLNTHDPAFPNTIILAANYRHDDNLLEEDEDRRWRVEDVDGGISHIIVPTSAPLAAVIDGQHRLFAFKFANLSKLSFPLVCSVFFDLPKPFQALLFATINSTQKSVPKSQTFELFGYNLEDEPSSTWTPDKLAVLFARRLNVEADSPLYGRIKIGASGGVQERLVEEREAKPGSFSDTKPWNVSMATIVEGILRLFSSNPKEDFNIMKGEANVGLQDRTLLQIRSSDKSPLRFLFIEQNDKLLAHPGS